MKKSLLYGGALLTIATAAHADESLTMYGITLYGVVDVGVAYQSHGAPLSDYYYPGLEYLISKNSNKSLWSLAPNGLSQSRVGLKGTEELVDDVSGIFAAEVNFVPTSGNLADALKSMTQNNGVPLGSQTSNADGSRAGQAFSGALYAGFKSQKYGTLTFGRQNGLLTDNIIKYDPMGASYAFSVIGYSGITAGSGNTQDTRLDNSVKYFGQYGPAHAGFQYQFGDSTGAHAKAYEVSVGADIANLSLDANFVKKKDAISASPLTAEQVAQLPALGFSPDNSLAATVSDNTSFAFMALYDAGKPKIYAGYEYIKFENPSSPIAPGTSDIGGYTLAFVNNNAFNAHRNLQVIWLGGRYSFTPSFVVAGAWYHYDQNNFFGSGCAGSNHSQCAGTLDALSLMADYHFTNRFDVYGGFMWSTVADGLANGFLNTATIDPMVGARFSF